MKSIELAVIIVIACVTSFVLGYGCGKSRMKGKVTMSDGLVRKSDVRKIISAYLAECIDDLGTEVDCLRTTLWCCDLNILIEEMKEVNND